MFPHKALLTGLMMIAPAPLLADAAPDMSGAELYQAFCASCHGPKARGNGPVAKSLRVKVPDLTRIAYRHDGQFPVELVARVIDGREFRAVHGTQDMPVWGQEFYGVAGDDPERRARSDELIDRLVGYLRTLQR
jgi:Cytochrome c